ncbi:MAG: TetR family transcriptional regulator C-terminal domain-containing protein [Clostridiales bacterium]|nr:TetR family transcriptional regulator C-terminal domain-containing protein [Clostridiales bacterium]
MASTIDRRVRKTKAVLCSGLIDLMKQKPVNKITVKELTDYVDINRGTFYLHHKDIFDLMQSIENELMQELKDLFEKYSTEEFQLHPTLFLTDIFRFLDHNAEIVTVLLSPNGDIVFVDRMETFVREKCLHNWMESFSLSNPLSYDYFYAFVISGIIGVFQNWLNRGRKESPEEIAIIVEQIISHGVQILK